MIGSGWPRPSAWCCGPPDENRLVLRDALSDLRYRLRSVFRRSDVERDLADEIRFHLERETEKLVTKGVAPDEARRQARLAFGGWSRPRKPPGMRAACGG